MSPTDLVLPLYLATLAVLGLFGLHRLWLVTRFRWRAESERPALPQPFPCVTVQLPLYDERTVAARLLRAVGELDWPRDRLEIQVLDDSSDETSLIVDAEVAALVRRGLDAKVLRRTDRRGFKAGALAHGQALARGELCAIFDADFVPRADFLRALVPSFADPRVGLVQARWEHLNRDESLLTRAQSVLLDGHFVIEHSVRHDEGLFFNFNGTAGIWRRAALEDAGGWQHDTLTEDLDLSYRAQLAGWKLVYRPLVSAPAEVPAELSAFQSQQHRWAKGSVQVAKKLAGSLARAELPLRVKLEACAHLTGNTGYPYVLLLAALLPLVAGDDALLGPLWHLAAFCLCTLSVVLFYARSQVPSQRSFAQQLVDVPAAMALGIGMSVAQSRAVFEGLFCATGEFVRTPKRGDGRAQRYRTRLGRLPLFELLFALWSGFGLLRAVQAGLWGSLPFLALFAAGFGWVALLSLREWSAGRPSRALAPVTVERSTPSSLTSL